MFLVLPSPVETSCFYHKYKSIAYTRLLEDRCNCFLELLMLVAVYIFANAFVKIIAMSDSFISSYITSLNFNNRWLSIKSTGFFRSSADFVCNRVKFASNVYLAVVS